MSTPQELNVYRQGRNNVPRGSDNIVRARAGIAAVDRFRAEIRAAQNRVMDLVQRGHTNEARAALAVAGAARVTELTADGLVKFNEYLDGPSIEEVEGIVRKLQERGATLSLITRCAGRVYDESGDTATGSAPTFDNADAFDDLG